MVSLRPIEDRVVVERAAPEERTGGGLVLPDTAKNKPWEGQVVAAGPGKTLPSGELRPLEVKPGDRVLFGPYSGDEVKVDGTTYVILKEEEILAVVD